MKRINRFVLKQLQGEELTKPQLKYFMGKGDPIEVEIICDSLPGRCWEWSDLENKCVFSGYQDDRCDYC